MAALTQNLLSPDQSQSTRTLRFQQMVALILNSLVTNGVLNQTDPGTWNVENLPNLLFTGHGAPVDGVAYVGDYYLDLDAGVLYLKS